VGGGEGNCFERGKGLIPNRKDISKNTNGEKEERGGLRSFKGHRSIAEGKQLTWDREWSHSKTKKGRGGSFYD